MGAGVVRIPVVGSRKVVTVFSGFEEEELRPKHFQSFPRRLLVWIGSGASRKW
jgi:hypothetical protein